MRILDIEIVVSEDNCQLKDSYKITDDDKKKEIIKSLIKTFPKIISQNRTERNLFFEWKAHNILYQHNYEIKRTKSVDFEFNQSLKHRICFWLIAHLVKEKKL